MSDKPIVKLHRNKNRYLLSRTGLWVRDFTRAARPQDINRLVAEADYSMLWANELANTAEHIPNIGAENVFAPNVVIVSDGHDFDKKQDVLNSLPKNVVIIGTNRSVAKWRGPRRMDWFVANNPYPECMASYPQRGYFPNCIVSSRTNPEFVRRYKASRSAMYKYAPMEDEHFSSRVSDDGVQVDDYRNPVCAAICLAYRWGVQRLVLFCCDDSFAGERPGADRLHNGLWTYPQHNVSHGLIEGMLFWLLIQKFNPVRVASHSAGPDWRGVPYIRDEEVARFFA